MLIRNWVLNSSHYKYDQNTWIDKILIDFFDVKNVHFDTTYKSWALEKLKAYLQPGYVDSETTGYAYNTFGPPGSNKQNSDFLLLFKQTGSIVGFTWTAATNPQTFRWDFGGVIYNQTISSTTPNMTYISEQYLIVTKTTSLVYSNMSDVILNNGTKHTGIFPKMAIAYRLQSTAGSHGYSGKLNIFGSPTTFDFGNGQLTGFYSYDWIHTDLLSLNLNNNYFPTSEQDSLLVALDNYFSSHTPLRNLTLNIAGTNMGSLTGGTSNTNLIHLRDVIYPAAGFTLTATVK